jgi:two-component system OmpR family sensor kinase
VRQDGWRRGPALGWPLSPALAWLPRPVSLRVRLVAVALCLLAGGAAVITVAGGRVARGYLMAQAVRQLLAYADRLTSQPFRATPIAPVGASPGEYSIEVRGSHGQLVLRSGPASHPGLAARAAAPRLGQLTTLAGASGGSYLAVAEPIRYSAQRIPYAYSAADFSLVVTSRAGPGLDGTLIVGLDLASIDRLTSRLTTVSLVTSGLALLAVAGLGAAAAAAALRPLTRLETTAAAIAAGCPPAPIVAGPAGDDPGRLAAPLNEALAQLAEPGPGAQAAAAPARDRAGWRPRTAAEITQELRRPIGVLRGLAEHYRHQGALTAGEQDRILRRVAEETARIDALAEDLRRSCGDEPGPDLSRK